MVLAENSIKELVAFDEIIAEISGRKDNPVNEWFEENLPFMNEDTRKDFDEGLDEFLEVISKVRDYIDRKKEDPTVGPLESAGMSITKKEIETIFYSFIMNVVHRLGNRAELISRALLIAAESSFEVLFGQLVRVIYVKNPSALPKSDYSFTLEELTRYASIDEAREALITHKIESLLRESVDDWARWLKRTINIPLDEVMPDWPVTREIFIRRNMLVHTDGRITERYLNELQRAGGTTTGRSVGQSLTPSVSYLRESLHRLIALEILLVFRVRVRADKNQREEAAGWLAGKLDFIVFRKMWDAACLLSDSFDSTECRRTTQLAVKINGWLAHKNRDGVDHIHSEVSAWDVSGLEERYSIVKKLLLDTLTDEELADAIKGNIFSQFEVSTHPLFANIRKSRSLELSPGETTQTSDS